MFKSAKFFMAIAVIHLILTLSTSTAFAQQDMGSTLVEVWHKDRARTDSISNPLPLIPSIEEIKEMEVRREIETDQKFKRLVANHQFDEIPSFQGEFKEIEDLETRLAAALDRDKPKNISSLLLRVLILFHFSKDKIEHLTKRQLTFEETKIYRDHSDLGKLLYSEYQNAKGHKKPQPIQRLKKLNADISILPLQGMSEGIDIAVSEGRHKKVISTGKNSENIKLNGDDTKP